MAWPCACQSPCQNSSLNGKDELAGAALRPASTKDSGTLTNTPIVSCIPTSALAMPFTPIADFIARYLEKDFQRILKTVLEARAPAPAP